MDTHKYWAFISYSHRDTTWATWLHKSLESYRPPRALIGTVTARGEVPKKLTPVFRDREELASSTALGQALNAALAGSLCQIVVCSPSAARSKWVNEEILAFKRLGREDRIFCFIVGGEPNASDDPAQAAEECFPEALRYQLGSDGNLTCIRTEPIAADARPGKDGRGNAKLKLIAGILGVGFDTLRQREQVRRQRRLFAIASAATAGMVITTGLAAAALIARAQAQRQTVIAKRQTVIAKREAETARQTTAFLVDLFRISDPGEARGNSLTARQVLDNGAARIGTQLSTQPQIQATLMDTLGTVYMGLGLYAQAKPLLESAAATRQALIPAEPADLALSLSHEGDLMTLRAEYSAADNAYRRAIALQSSLPSDQKDAATLAKSLFGLGTELRNQGRFEEAEPTLRKALALQEQLTRGASEDKARTLQVLAMVVNERSQSDAIPLLERAVAMQRTLWGAEPYPDFADALNDLGLMLHDKGDYDPAERLLRESMAMKRRLLGEKHPEIAVSMNNLAMVLQDKGDLAGAEATYRQALAMQRELLGDVHPLVANSLNNIAFVMYDRGDVRGALETERASLSTYQTLFPGDNPDVARIMNRLGYWLTETGDYPGAERYLSESLAMRRRLFGKDHQEIASSLVHVGILQVATHKYRDALESAGAAADIFNKALSASNWKTAVAQSVEGAALTGIGDYPAAEKLLVQGYTFLSNDAGTLPTYRSLARRYMQDLYRSWGRPIEARRYAGTSFRTGHNPIMTSDAAPKNVVAK